MALLIVSFGWQCWVFLQCDWYCSLHLFHGHVHCVLLVALLSVAIWWHCRLFLFVVLLSACVFGIAFYFSKVVLLNESVDDIARHYELWYCSMLLFGALPSCWYFNLVALPIVPIQRHCQVIVFSGPLPFVPLQWHCPLPSVPSWWHCQLILFGGIVQFSYLLVLPYALIWLHFLFSCSVALPSFPIWWYRLRFLFRGIVLLFLIGGIFLCSSLVAVSYVPIWWHYLMFLFSCIALYSYWVALSIVRIW